MPADAVRWDVASAQAHLPVVRDRLEILRRHLIVWRSTEGEPSPHVLDPQGLDPQGLDQQLPDPRPVSDLDRLVHQAIVGFDHDGIVVRDVVRGLVDFPIRATDGVVYLACWQDDDGDTIAWWHLPDEGFAGRKPLPRLSGE